MDISQRLFSIEEIEAVLHIEGVDDSVITGVTDRLRSDKHRDIFSFSEIEAALKACDVPVDVSPIRAAFEVNAKKPQLLSQDQFCKIIAELGEVFDISLLSDCGSPASYEDDSSMPPFLEGEPIVNHERREEVSVGRSSCTPDEDDSSLVDDLPFFSWEEISSIFAEESFPPFLAVDVKALLPSFELISTRAVITALEAKAANPLIISSIKTRLRDKVSSLLVVREHSCPGRDVPLHFSFALICTVATC